jgi:hypothetical protein
VRAGERRLTIGDRVWYALAFLFLLGWLFFLGDR